MNYRLLDSVELLNSFETRGNGFAFKEYVELNGVKQGIIVEGERWDNPVLLFLHGGPGIPIYPLVKRENFELHKYFTICYWDQRGTGMSYVKSTINNPLTLEQLKKDTVALSNYLIKKFNQKKIYIMGHSWGSFLGSIVAANFPQYYHAYIGTGQVGDQTESEKETKDFLWEKAVHHSDQKALEEMEHVEIDQFYFKNQAYGKLRDKYVNEYGGGMMREGLSNRELTKSYLSCKAYKLKERINIFRGAMNSFPLIENLATNQLINLAPQFDIPIFIMQGKNDYQTTYNQAKKFFDAVEAPSKVFYTFENSAHSPFLDEKDYFYRIIEKDILTESKRVSV